jgi:hypothetical protein
MSSRCYYKILGAYPQTTPYAELRFGDLRKIASRLKALFNKIKLDINLGNPSKLSNPWTVPSTRSAIKVVDLLPRCTYSSRILTGIQILSMEYAHNNL